MLARALAILATAALVACAGSRDEPRVTRDERSGSSAAPRADRAAPEYQVALIPLAGPAAQLRAELSGLAWFGDHLIVLPQYPERMASGEPGDAGVLFAIPRAALEAHIQGLSRAPIEPRTIRLIAPGLAERIPGYEGFESIVFVGARALLTIESDGGEDMASYLVHGIMAEDLSTLTLETQGEAPPRMMAPARVANASYETMVVVGDRLLALYEANGAAVNPTPRAQVFDLEGHAVATAPMPALEYRVTDATSADADGRFWVINYMYPGDADDYRPAEDALAARHGQGPSHAASAVVERLVELRYHDERITLVERPPVQLSVGTVGRNWEGLVRMGDDGFLMVTDRYPETLLGYVRAPITR